MFHRPPATLIADAHIAAGFHVGCRQSVSHQRLQHFLLGIYDVKRGGVRVRPFRCKLYELRESASQIALSFNQRQPALKKFDIPNAHQPHLFRRQQRLHPIGIVDPSSTRKTRGKHRYGAAASAAVPLSLVHLKRCRSPTVLRAPPLTFVQLKNYCPGTRFAGECSLQRSPIPPAKADMRYAYAFDPCPRVRRFDRSSNFFGVLRRSCPNQSSIPETSPGDRRSDRYPPHTERRRFPQGERRLPMAVDRILVRLAFGCRSGPARPPFARPPLQPANQWPEPWTLYHFVDAAIPSERRSQAGFRSAPRRQDPFPRVVTRCPSRLLCKRQRQSHRRGSQSVDRRRGLGRSPPLARLRSQWNFWPPL